MAIRNTAELPGQLRSTDRLPSRTRAVAQCVEEEFTVSKSSGNPMIVRTWEVRIPEAVSINGAAKGLAGIQVKQYLPTICIVDGKRDDTKSNSALARLRDENKSLGLPHEQIDDENPELLCKGIYADVNLGPDEYAITNPPTPEEIALGKKIGSPKMGADGKPEMGYRVKLEGILGRATPVAGQPW